MSGWNELHFCCRLKTLSLTYSLSYLISGVSLLYLAVQTINKMKHQSEVETTLWAEKWLPYSGLPVAPGKCSTYLHDLRGTPGSSKVIEARRSDAFSKNNWEQVENFCSLSVNWLIWFRNPAPAHWREIWVVPVSSSFETLLESVFC